MKEPLFKKALIAGATSDMARAFASLLASEKIDLVLAARRPEELEPDAANLRIRYGISVECIPLDITSEKSRSDCFARLKDVTLVAMFAGYLGDQTRGQEDAAEALRIIESNYTGQAIFLEKAAAYLLKQQGRRAIVGVSSVAGDRGRQSNYLYGSAKAGFTAYLSGLRNRLYRSGIHVLTVKPGFVRTAMTAGMPLPGPITARPEQTARDIFQALRKGRDVLYTLWMWRYIMWIICSIPESIFKRLKL
jgi:short-subunit dehydrogenase